VAHTPHRTERCHKDQRGLTDATLAPGGAVVAEAVRVYRADVTNIGTRAPSIEAIPCAALRERCRGFTTRLAGVGHQNACEGLGEVDVTPASGFPNTGKDTSRTSALARTGAPNTQEILAHTVVVAEAGVFQGGTKRKSKWCCKKSQTENREFEMQDRKPIQNF